MPAIIHWAKARKKDDGWYHPRTGDKVSDSPNDTFVMYITESATDEMMITLILDRAATEQVEEGIRKALTIDPVVIRKCQ